MGPSAWNKRAVCWLLLVTAIAAVVRCAPLGESLWLDELHTAWVVAGTWSDVAARARIGNQSPLYFYLVRAVTTTLGMSEFSLRLPSLLAGLALLPLAWRLTWNWSRSRTAAIVVASCIAWDHWCVFYAQEARSYALVQFVGLLQIGCFWRLCRGAPARWRVGFVAATATMFYLHYTSSLVVAGELVAYALWSALRGKALPYRPHHALLDAACCAALIAPAWPHLREIAAQRQNWSLMVRKPAALSLITLLSLETYVAPPLLGWIASLCAHKIMAGRADTSISGDASSTRGSFFGAASDRALLAAATLTACWFCVPLAATWLLTTGDIARLFMVRYLMAAVVAPMILGGLLLAAISSQRLRYGLATAVVALSLWHSGLLSQLYDAGRFVSDRQQDWRKTVATIRSDRGTANWPVLVRSGFVEADRLRTSSDPLLRAYCLAPVTGLYRLDGPSRPLIPLPTTRAGQLTDASLAELGGQPGAWVVIYGAARSRPRIERDLAVSLQRMRLRSHVAFRETYGNILLLRLSWQ